MKQKKWRLVQSFRQIRLLIKHGHQYKTYLLQLQERYEKEVLNGKSISFSVRSLRYQEEQIA